MPDPDDDVTFGDIDPEDEYDAGDPIPVRLLVISRIVEALDLEADLVRRALRRVIVARLLRAIATELDHG